MKQTIKIKVLTEGCTPVISKGGDWIDLRAAEDIHLESPYAIARSRKGGESSRKVVFPTKYIPLGIAMQLPAGMEGNVVARSSANKNFHVIQSNAFAVIDQPYCGPNDQWHMPVMATGEVNIKKGDRICQFRIEKHQPTIKFEEVQHLEGEERGGFGSSGKQ